MSHAAIADAVIWGLATTILCYVLVAGLGGPVLTSTPAVASTGAVVAGWAVAVTRLASKRR